MADLKIHVKSQADVAAIRKAADSLKDVSADADKAANSLRGLSEASRQADSTNNNLVRSTDQVAQAKARAASQGRGLHRVLSAVNTGATAAGAGIGIFGRALSVLSLTLAGGAAGLIAAGLGSVVGWLIKLATESDKAVGKLKRTAETAQESAVAHAALAENVEKATEALRKLQDAHFTRTEREELAKLAAERKVEEAKLERGIAEGGLPPEAAASARAELSSHFRGQEAAIRGTARESKIDSLQRQQSKIDSAHLEALRQVTAAQAALRRYDENPYRHEFGFDEVAHRTSRPIDRGVLEGRLQAATERATAVGVERQEATTNIREQILDLQSEGRIARKELGAEGVASQIRLETEAENLHREELLQAEKSRQAREREFNREMIRLIRSGEAERASLLSEVRDLASQARHLRE